MAGASGGAPARRGRILVIDDDVLLVKTIVRLLRADHDVTSAHDGRAAMRALEADESFDVILCDLMLSDMSGIELYRQLTSERPRMLERIAFMTGGATTALAPEFLRRVPNEVIDKPFSSETLADFVRSRVNARRSAP